MPKKTLLLPSSSLPYLQNRGPQRPRKTSFLQLQIHSCLIPLRVKNDRTGKVCYRVTRLDFITAVLLLRGSRGPAAASALRASQPGFVPARCGQIAVAFLPFDPPIVAQYWSGNHEPVCLSVCKPQEAAPAKSPKSSERTKPRCQNNTTPSPPLAGPLSVIITCLFHSPELQQVQAERALRLAQG